MADVTIHPTAMVDPQARLGAGTTVGPCTIIGAGVEIGPRCKIGAFVTIQGPTRMGAENILYNYAAIGTDSQDLKYKGDADTRLEIGDANIIREYVTINRATEAGGVTIVGSHNAFMANSHVAHNCVVGDHTIFANCASIGGHVKIDDHAILGGLVGVHQFCRVGRHAIVGSSSKVVLDIPPFVTADGNPARLFGINRIGLQRRGFSPDEIVVVRRAFALLRGSGTIADRRDGLGPSGQHPYVDELVEFVEASQRGIARTARGREIGEDGLIDHDHGDDGDDAMSAVLSVMD